MLIDNVLGSRDRHVHTIRPDASVTEAAKVMNRYRIGVLVVTDDAGRMVGVVSERDVVGSIGAGGPKAIRFTVGDLMSHNVITCRGTDNVDDVMRLMVRNRIRHVPVVDENGALCGLISSRDLMTERLQEETEAVNRFLTINRCRPHTPGYRLGH